MAGEETARPDRRRAMLAILPFLALGLADVALVVTWGLDPLWAGLVLVPILAVSVLGWFALAKGVATPGTEAAAHDG